VPSILLVRHAQGSFGGENYDVLSDTGREQAELLAADLVRRGVRPVKVLTGALARQRDTAMPIAAAAGCPVEVDERWHEYESEDILAHHSSAQASLERHGDDAPQLTSREFQQLLDAALLAWIAASDGGPAAEPYPVFAARVHAALEDLAGSLGQGETAVACTSGGPLAAVCVALLGLPPTHFVPFNRVAVNTGVTKVITGRRGMTLVTFNEHGHLERPDGALVTYR
jgi:broad specificity phosphatase PhoE